MSHRLFLALLIPKTAQDALGKLHTYLAGADWVKPEQMHLTLRFLGAHISDAEMSELQGSLKQIQGEPFDFDLVGVGRFPLMMSSPPRVLWVGIEAPPALRRLYQQIEAAVDRPGYVPQESPFHPHITLARMRIIGGRTEVEQYLKRYKDIELGNVHAGSFALMESHLTPEGAHYSVIAKYPFAPNGTSINSSAAISPE